MIMSSMKQIGGYANTAIIGDNNTVHNTFSSASALSKSDIADLLDAVKNRTPKEGNEEEESEGPPKGLNKKLRFNNVKTWKAIFDEDCTYYADIAEVMEDFPASDDIIRHLHTMFCKRQPNHELGGRIQGDKLLSDLHDELLAEVDNSSANWDEALSERKFSQSTISEFVSSLLKRAVVLCKVLFVPGNEAEMSDCEGENNVVD